MNYFKEITPLTTVQGTSVVAGAVTGGTIDFVSYEPRFGVVLSVGTAVAAMSSTVAWVHTSSDGSTWGTLGTIAATAGAQAGTVYYGSMTADARYVRGHLAVGGAGGTALAGINLLVKRRTVD